MFLQFVLGGFILIDLATFLRHLSLDYDLGHGFFLFASFKQVLGVFLLFAFGWKSFCFPSFSRVLFQFLCGLRGKSGELKNGFYSEKVLDGHDVLPKDIVLNDVVDECTEKSISYPDFYRKINRDFDEKYHFDNNSDDDNKENIDEEGESDPLFGAYDDESQTEEVDESDVSALRESIKIGQRRAKAARAELEKERAASATAAEEAMAMILRLQKEKSSIEMESIQYRRLAEEKQIHDQEVLRSLRWLVWKNESEMRSLQEELNLCRRKLNGLLKGDGRDELEEEVEEVRSFCSGYNEDDVLENVLYI